MFARLTYDQQLDTVVTHAWETWTKNGLNLDEDDRIQTEKSVRDAASNTYTDGIDEIAWLDATLKALGHEAT